MKANDIRVKFDIGELRKLVVIHCNAFACSHNTANRSHGESIGLCDYKHIVVDENGKCTACDVVERSDDE